MMEKVNGNWDIIRKNGQRTFHTSKPENFNSLREVIFIMTLLPLKAHSKV